MSNPFMKLFLSTVFILNILWLAPASFAQHLPEGKKMQSLQERYNTLLASIGPQSSDSLLGSIYDQMLLFQNASLDREIMLRQKLRFADDETKALFRAKDSLMQRVARTYERPDSLRGDVLATEAKAREIEEIILKRVQRGRQYFMALSVRFMEEIYENDPSLRCLRCYKKVRKKGGDQQLADQLYVYASRKDRSNPSWRQVKQALTNKDAAIEFVWYRDAKSGGMRYGALVLRRNFTAPRYVALCTQDQLNEALHKDVRDEIYYMQNLYAPPSNDEESTLYELIWAPLAPLVSDARKVYYTPAGDLYRLNLAAISAGEKQKPLQDQFEFALINSTRSLIDAGTLATGNHQALPSIQLPCGLSTPVGRDFLARFLGHIEIDYYNPDIFSAEKTAALFGNIYYEMDSAAIRRPDIKVHIGPQLAPATQSVRKRQTTKGMEWDFLPGAQQEINNIRNMLKESDYTIRVYEGYAASEESFKSLGRSASPRIIHIATHGFFLADTLQYKRDDQLNRSGLILAGANYAWKKGFPLTGMEDGIVSAFEISLMNLQNTELVVLSACETGLGYIVNNEGVFGLQRAFKKAGVKNLLVSLWSIPDKATQALMTQFYQNCLEKNMPIRRALRTAQQWMREQEIYDNPYYWAGFVLLE